MGRGEAAAEYLGKIKIYIRGIHSETGRERGPGVSEKGERSEG